MGWEKITIKNKRISAMNPLFTNLDSSFDNEVVFFLHEIPDKTFINSNEYKLVDDTYFQFLNNHYTTPYPVIHFCRDFREYPRKNFYIDNPNVPRYIHFIDSSIWNFYASNKTEINKCLHKIKKYFDLGYYDLVIARETANLRVRLLKESKIYGPRGGNAEAGHGASVSPFLFHSETKMSGFLNEKIEKNIDVLLNQPEWRVLLLDDHSNSTLGGSETLNKYNIVEHRLEEICELIRDSVKRLNATQISSKKKNSVINHYSKVLNVFTIEKVASVDEAVASMEAKKYDLILLDYLLGEKDDGREYSHELLDKVKTNNELQESKGIYGTFWFFFISSFTYAIEERLQEQGLTYNTKDWRIARGACPTTTPELFKYNLFRFLHRQTEVISQLPLLPKSDKKDDYANRTLTILDLLKKVYCSENPRENAVKYFDSVLTIKANYKILKRDFYHISKEKEKSDDWKKKNLQDRDTEKKDNGSLLIQSLFPDLKHYDNAFWEHLIHLVYVTAFGTIRQWPELWEEFLFVKDYLEKSDNSKKVIDRIEEYIVKLKAGNY